MSRDKYSSELEISLPLSAQIADILRRKIISGEIKKDEKLSERILSLQFEVSTAPVKEAIHTLSMEGLVYSIPRKGTYVSDFNYSNLVQMIHLRSVVEGTAAFWGTKNISNSDIEKMGEYLKYFENYLNDNNVKEKEMLDELTNINYSFHKILSRASKNTYLLQLIKTLDSINNTIRLLYYDKKSDDEHVKSYNEHSQLYDAVKKRNCELAEEITVKHIKRVATTLIPRNDNFI